MTKFLCTCYMCLATTVAARARAERLREELQSDGDEQVDRPKGFAAIIGKWPGDETDEEIDRYFSR